MSQKNQRHRSLTSSSPTEKSINLLNKGVMLKIKSSAAKVTGALAATFGLFTALVLSSGLIPSFASARPQRVMIFMKDQASFTQIQNHFTKFGSQNLKSQTNLWGAAPHALAQVDGNIQTTLRTLNGVIVKIADPSEMQKLRLNPAVEFVDEEVFHPAPKPVHGFAKVSKFSGSNLRPMDDITGDFVPNASTPWGITAVKAVEAWPLSHRGEGARVLVLDTGIDKDHPSLTANLEKGKSFVDPYGLAYDYFDDVGHGTHVAGTIVGISDSSGFTGVAPKSKLLMGKVCTPEGCSNFSVAQGIEWGIQEKVDVVSMSLGGAQATPTERRAVSKAAAAGITIVAASGNDGIPQVSYPAALPTVIAVGAVNADLLKADFSQWGPELAVVAPGVDVVSSVPQGSGRTPIVQIQLGTSPAITIPSSFIEGSKTILEPLTKELIDVGFGRPEDFAKVAAAGKLALVKRGENKFMEKIKAGLDAKIAGLIVYNNVPGLIHGAISQDGSEIEIPIFVIELSQGELIKASLAAGNIAQSKLVVQKSNYSSFDGTSMATPHVAGVVALIKATNKKLTPAQVKTILQSTAKKLTPNTNNELGAGIVQADLAVEKAVHPDVTDIPLGINLN
jgi:serine protease